MELTTKAQQEIKEIEAKIEIEKARSARLSKEAYEEGISHDARNGIIKKVRKTNGRPEEGGGKKMKNQKRIEVKGNGNQAPYGIGEIMKTFAPTKAGLKKAGYYARNYYNRPTIIDAEGKKHNPDNIDEIIF
jgi:hypothetical protein